MHILLVHQFFLKDNDGGGSRWNEMSRIWVEEGHRVTVLAGTIHYMGKPSAPNSEKWFHKNVNKDGVEVISCYTSTQKDKSFTERLWSFLSFTFSSIFGGIFYAKENYDLILVTSPPLFVGVTGFLLSRWKRIPLVFEVRDLWPESAIETGVLKNEKLIRFSYWFEAYAYRKARLINVLTPAFRDILITKKNVPAEKIIYIPNAADFPIADQVSSNFDAKDFRCKHNLEGKFVITYVGAHGIANHLIQVLKTAEIIQDTNVLFLLIGEGEQKEALMEDAKNRELANIRFLDKMPKNEVFEYILASDMGASILKKTEIFKTIYSNKTFDYFSCKKPVLMVIDGISRKLVEEANAGIFIEPENPTDFADKIRQCIENQDLLRMQGESGYQHAKTHFDREILAKQYLTFLIEMKKKPEPKK